VLLVVPPVPLLTGLMFVSPQPIPPVVPLINSFPLETFVSHVLVLVPLVLVPLPTNVLHVMLVTSISMESVLPLSPVPLVKFILALKDVELLVPPDNLQMHKIFVVSHFQVVLLPHVLLINSIKPLPTLV